jgi:hypothetical protein
VALLKITSSQQLLVPSRTQNDPTVGVVPYDLLVGAPSLLLNGKLKMAQLLQSICSCSS